MRQRVWDQIKDADPSGAGISDVEYAQNFYTLFHLRSPDERQQVLNNLAIALQQPTGPTMDRAVQEKRYRLLKRRHEQMMSVWK